jgi:hypothetical protein
LAILRDAPVTVAATANLWHPRSAVATDREAALHAAAGGGFWGKKNNPGLTFANTGMSSGRLINRTGAYSVRCFAWSGRSNDHVTGLANDGKWPAQMTLIGVSRESSGHRER